MNLQEQLRQKQEQLRLLQQQLSDPQPQHAQLQLQQTNTRKQSNNQRLALLTLTTNNPLIPFTTNKQTNQMTMTSKNVKLEASPDVPIFLRSK